MRGHRDLRWCVIAAVVCAVVATLVPFEVVRLLAALPLTLFLPGYAIVAVTFGRSNLAAPKRLMLSVAVSLMALALGALVLNVFPFGIRTWSWAVLLVAIVVAACRGAALRRGRAAPRQQRDGRLSLPTLRPSWGAGCLVAALLIATAAVVLAQQPLPAKNASGFTALWMLPADSDEEAVVVGVDSNEQDAHSYRLRVDVGGKSQSSTYRVKLDPGEERTFEVEVPRASAGRRHVVASLYRVGNPERLFRRVTSWLPRQQSFP